MSSHRMIEIPTTRVARSVRPETAGPERWEEYSPLVSVEWVAWYLGVTKARVWELTRADLIPHTTIGRRRAYSRSAIIAWAESGGSTYPGGWRREVAE